MQNKNKLTESKNSDDELFRKCLHDIRNMKELNNEMIIKIDNMSHKDKLEIILTFNEVLQALKCILDS